MGRGTKLKQQKMQSEAGRRAEILEIALDLFCEKGFRGTSVLDIAMRARTSKETIYAWFGNKEQLFETLFREGSARGGNTMPLDTRAIDPRVFLHAYACAVLNFTNSRLYMLMLMALAEGIKFEPLRRSLWNVMRSGRENVVACFNQWREAGLMEFDDAEAAVSLFTGMVNGDWANRRSVGIIQNITPEQITAHAERATSMFLKAVAPSNPSN
jgi:AcrR family transcriptional regulator